MTPEQFTDWLALHAAAEAARLGITPPQTAITRMACGQDSEIEFILTIRKRQRATLQFDEATGCSFIGPATEPPPANTATATDDLSPMQRRVLDVLDTEHRRKGTWIASKVCKAGRGGGGFRAALAVLKRRNLIGHEKGRGYYLMSAPE